MMLAIVFALVGIGILLLPRNTFVFITAGWLFVMALLVALVDQAGW